MQCLIAKTFSSQVFGRTHILTRPCDVFINHRGIDTKRNLAALLYHDLLRLGLHPFLDNKSIRPGDNILHNIDSAIINCKVGIALFSPNYVESYYCLHELALMMQCKKKVIPIFFDIKPSELQVVDDGTWEDEQFKMFKSVLDEAKSIVGLKFNSSDG